MNSRKTKLHSFLRVLCEPSAGTEVGDIGLVRKLERSVEGISVLSEFGIWVINHLRKGRGHFVKEIVPVIPSIS
jgi:hypothetical protein